MENTSSAFDTPIPEGLVRILFKVDSIECEVENDAPDFIEVSDDTPNLSITPEADVTDITDVFSRSYTLELRKRKSKEDRVVWELEKDGIWFDAEMDKVKNIWLSEFRFYIESAKPRYLAYFIKDVKHSIEWLQMDSKSGEIKSLSNFKKKYSPPPVSDKEVFPGSEVLKCADMIGRASRKIDIRTGTAMVKFNTDKGRLEPLITGMAERLGYKIEALDKETIYKEDGKGNSVSHSIALK